MSKIRRPPPVPRVRTREERLANLRYLFRARSIGVFEWTCPACAWINKSREVRRTRTVTCNNEECRRPFGHGHILYVMPYGGIKIAPRDTVIPRTGMIDAFPVGEVDTWEHGQLLNRVVVIPEETIRQLIEADSTIPIDDHNRATDGSP